MECARWMWPLAVAVGLAGCPGSVPDEAVFGADASGTQADVALADLGSGPVDGGSAPADSGPNGVDSGKVSHDAGKANDDGGAKVDVSVAVDSGPAVTPKVVHITAGGATTCAGYDDGSALCWGSNTKGQLGNDKGGSGKSSAVPVTVGGPAMSGVDCGDEHCCGLDGDSKLWCWGTNQFGQAGMDSGFPSFNKPNKLKTDGAVKAVAAGGAHTCILLPAGNLRCWGLGNSGQLGQGEEKTSNTPVDVTWLKEVEAIDAAFYSSCARTKAGDIWCWGYNGMGQVGTSSSDKFVETPIKVAGVVNVVAFATGLEHTCAAQKGDKVYCWGRNGSHQLGKGSGNSSYSTPQESLGLTDVVALAVGDAHSCAVQKGGKVWCWGANTYGESGQAKGPLMIDYPKEVPGVTNAVTIVSGNGHTCVLTTNNEVWCWGTGGQGQIGTGSKADQFGPVKVL